MTEQERALSTPRAVREDPEDDEWKQEDPEDEDDDGEQEEEEGSDEGDGYSP